MAFSSLSTNSSALDAMESVLVSEIFEDETTLSFGLGDVSGASEVRVFFVFCSPQPKNKVSRNPAPKAKLERFMKFEDFKLAVSKIKNLSLPGFVAHLEMVPPDRIPADATVPPVPTSAKKAAVLALCYPDNQDLTRLLLILRPPQSGVHAAQVAFPGGGMEIGDRDLLATAIREAQEEVGVSPEELSPIRSLTEIYIPPSNYLVQPYLAWTPLQQRFMPQPAEVDRIIEVPLSNLLRSENRTYCIRNTSYAGPVEVPAFSFEGHIVWGATAMMLNELRIMLKSL